MRINVLVENKIGNKSPNLCKQISSIKRIRYYLVNYGNNDSNNYNCHNSTLGWICCCCWWWRVAGWIYERRRQRRARDERLTWVKTSTTWITFSCQTLQRAQAASSRKAMWEYVIRFVREAGDRSHHRWTLPSRRKPELELGYSEGSEPWSQLAPWADID